MAYEKLNKLNTPQEFKWNQAKIVDIETDNNNGEFYLRQETNERYFKVYFTVANENGDWVKKDMPYSQTMMWGDKPPSEYIKETLRACGLKEDFTDSDRIYKEDIFVSVSGEVYTDDKGYIKSKFFINPMRTLKSVKESNPLDLLKKFESMNKDTQPQNQQFQSPPPQSNPVQEDEEIPDGLNAVDDPNDNSDIPF